MMLGFLLARAGVEVVVLEKHPDFLRDFRGDTIHPSTLEVIRELGLLDEFLKLPHEEARRLSGVIGDELVRIVDFTHLRTRCRFIALIPQWDFLNFLAGHAKRYPNFHLRMQAEVTDLLEEGGRIAGVRASTHCGLTNHPERINRRRRRTPFSGARARGTCSRRSWCTHRCAMDASVAATKRRCGAARSHRRWQDDGDAQRWYRPGLLCIGDAAHAMSPVGGVGINLAILDAVAAANRLVGPLRDGAVSERDLSDVQRRRMFPTRATQRVQIFIHDSF
jgi:2-polyprenyl-6-methoxyphenol hydroxylase-like FAD-dependent oxidoreductase